MLSQIAVLVVLFFFLLVIVGILSGENTFSRYVAIAFDSFWNVMTGGLFGMTISARAYVRVRNGAGGFWKFLYKFLNMLEADHCEIAVQTDIDRAKAVQTALAPYDLRKAKS